MPRTSARPIGILGAETKPIALSPEEKQAGERAVLDSEQSGLVLPGRASAPLLTIAGSSLSASDAVSILASLHQGEGATVVFRAPNPGTTYGAVSSARLREMWPRIQPAVEDGACFFSINSGGKAYKAQNATGLFASCSQAKLSYLNALYVDIDRHDEYPDADLDLLRQRALGLSEFLGMPSPTWTVNSGRGVWLLWAFSVPIAATPESRAHWQATAESLADSFAQLKPDRASSTTANRIMRVPGSRNPGAAGARVEFVSVGRPSHFYDLAAKLGVKAQPTPITRQEEERRAKNPAKVKAARARWQKTYRGLEKLVQ